MPLAIHREVPVFVVEKLFRMVAPKALAKRGLMWWEAADVAVALHVLNENPTLGLAFTDVHAAHELPRQRNCIIGFHLIYRDR